MIGLEKGIVQVIPLRSSWRANYGQERRLLKEHIGGHVLDIRHAGSTALPELDGKPIIDIAVAVASTLEIARCRPPLRLNDLGYIDRGDSGRDGGYLFVTEPHPRCGPIIRTWMRSHSCDSRSYLPDRGPRSHDGGAWGGSDGTDVRIAGIDAGHPAVNSLQGYVATTEGATDTLDYDETPHEDLYGHGTACAGIIRSLAPCCEFYSVRVLDENLTGRARSSPPDCAGRSRLGCMIAT
jgi:hypothetical protein